MAFSPAWGGVIPLVPIGSFRDFLGHRRKGKTVNQWFTGTFTRAAVTSALKTTAGRRAAQNMSSLLRSMGFKAPPGSLGIELQGYIAFQKFQHREAVKRGDRAAQRRIERLMALPRNFQRAGTNALQFPIAYFDMLAKPSPGGRRTREDEERRKAFTTWFDRRKRRKGRFTNV